MIISLFISSLIVDSINEWTKNTLYERPMGPGRCVANLILIDITIVLQKCHSAIS